MAFGIPVSDIIIASLILLLGSSRRHLSFFVESADAKVDESTHQNFADELTTNLYTKENEFSSTLGVSMVFSLLYPGSTDVSMTQIRDVLGFSSPNTQLVWEEVSQRLDSAYEGQCGEGSVVVSDIEGDNIPCEQQAPKLEIANSVWFDDQTTLALEYEQVVGEYAKQVDFDSTESSNIVNEWVFNKTNGLIDSVVPENTPLFPPYLLIAINSIYLKASWTNQFSESKTNQDSFYGSASRDLEVSQAHFMHEVFDSVLYSHEAIPGYQILQLPFVNSQLSMIFVLPMIDEIGAIMSTDVLSSLDQLQRKRVALALPKFKFETKYEADLKQALVDIGITAPFSSADGLCGIFGTGCGPFIDKIIQKTYIDVNEKGVEAAAVTVAFTVVSAPIDPPTLMMLDHPFQFYIYDSSEHLILFEGRLGEPELPEDDPEVELLSAKHSDNDFWFTNFYVNPIDPPIPIIASEDPTTISPTVLSTSPQGGDSSDLSSGDDESAAQGLLFSCHLLLTSILSFAGVLTFTS